MTVPTSFETFRKALEIDTATVDSAADLQQRARKALEALPGFERSFLSGSYARNTRLDPLNDIDIVVVVADTAEWNDDPETAMRAAGEVVRPEFPGCRISMGAHAAKIVPEDPPIEGVHLDVVVARSAGWGSSLEISERLPSPTWKLSDPEAHRVALSKANEAWAGRLVPMIKQVKHWNRNASGDGLKSFLVEALALRIFTGSGDRSAAEMIQKFFAEAKSAILTPTTNPAVPDGVVDGDLTGDERASHSDRLAKASKAADDAVSVAKTDEDAAEDIWHGLFGDPFPKPVRDDAKEAIAKALRAGTAGAAGGTLLPGGGRPIIPARSFGDRDA